MTPTRTVCYVCKTRLSIDDTGKCLVCLDREVLERQRAGDQADLGKWSR